MAKKTKKVLKPPALLPLTGFYGVSAAGKRWKAQTTYDKKKHHLGCFDTKEEAAFAYDKKVRQCAKDKSLNYESIKAAEEAAAQAKAKYVDANPQLPMHRPPSGFHGVAAVRKRWSAKIGYDNKNHNLGCFDTKQEAALAYDREARQRGEDKQLNYESIAAAEEAAARAQAEHTLAHPKQLKPRPPSGFYGVAANGKRWQAQIRYDNKGHHLGTFNSKQEAALAYDREARQCGEDKLLNYESIAAAEEAAARAQAEHAPTESGLGARSFF
jgi:hypothetical protein